MSDHDHDHGHDSRRDGHESPAADRPAADADPTSDRIERSVEIDAPQARVWRALANAEEFGSWFGVDLRGQTFVPGQRTRGRITHPGFDRVPAGRRREAFRMNSGGWDAQVKNLRRRAGG